MIDPDSTRSVSYLYLFTDPRFKIILLVSAVGMIGALLPPALPALGSGLDVGDETIGYVITAYKLPSILIIPIAAAVADIYGRRTVLLPSLILFGVAGSLILFLRSFSAVLLLTLFLGIGAAAIFPLTVTLLGDFFQDERNSAGQGIRVGVIGLGAVFVPVATGYLAEIKWNYPFLLFFFVFPVVGIVYLFLKEPVKQAPSKRSLRTTATEYLQAIRNELSDPALAILLGGGFVRGFSRYALVTFVPLFAVRVLSASLVVAGILLSIRGVIYTLVAPFAGELVKRFARKWLLAGSLAVSGVALFALPLSPTWLGSEYWSAVTLSGTLCSIR